MTLLYDELLKIYCRFSQEATESLENDSDDGWHSYEANAETMDKLAVAIVGMAAPKTVGDVMILPDEDLRTQGLIYLIDRDASAVYDQVYGYVDLVIWNQIEGLVTPAQHGFDGLKLCEWIDQEFPSEPLDGR